MPAIKSRNPINAANGLSVDFRYPAGADLSTCQYRFVQLSTTKGEVVGATSACAPHAWGVLQNAPTASKTAIVRVWGVTQAVLPATACTLRHGDFISVTGCGGVIYAGTSGMAYGRWLSASVASLGTGTCTIFVNAILPTASQLSAS